ncbi:ATP-binding protein [Streptomyces sp. AgN23]|uniref:ATP-binding protein n=2 Tax=Streptomyces sp. AgN23 TaxID=1188315 RepID=UPI001FF40243|nr:ATP-binding protein [Streptomyces sp. AgN23]WTB02826.1 ATP-binding protein [Streptomyces antimycoticus]WTB11294.1 ATP-binding protein [Streptomyces antimycoticus]
MRAELPPGTHPRLLRPEGIHWRGRLYHASWITGQVTAQVVVRPHASPGDGIDVYHPSGRRLGTALPITLASTEGTPMTDTTGTETAAADASGAEPDFYLNLADARIVATEALLEAGENIADTIDARAMSCIYGDAGLGKTFSVLAALKEVAADLVLFLQFRSRPTPRDIRHELFTLLNLEGKAPTHPSEFDQLLKRSLARRPYVLAFDEAQQFSRECFEFVRHLWDTGQGKNRPAVLFIGGEECYKTLYNDPALASRIYIWQEFTPMEPDEVLKNIPHFHPLWANTSPELINYIDQEAGAGTFRMWSKITHHILEGMKRRGLDEVDETIARWAIRRVRPPRQRHRRDESR